jgi:hypothetical protein
MVVGSPDPLHHPRRAFRRSQLDDQVHVAPVDPEIQRRGADHRAQRPARHRRLDLAPLLGRERAVVQRDRQVVLVEPPQLLEGELGLESRVDEHEGDAGLADLFVDPRHGVAGGVAGPGHAALGEQHVDHRRCARRAAHQVDRVLGRRRQPAADHVRIVDGGREADPAQARRELLQPGQAQRQVAALGGPGRVHSSTITQRRSSK